MDQFPYFVGIVISFFYRIGNAATFKQFPMIFQDSPRKRQVLLVWTAAIGAPFGPLYLIFNFLPNRSGITIIFWINAFFICPVCYVH